MPKYHTDYNFAFYSLGLLPTTDCTDKKLEEYLSQSTEVFGGCLQNCKLPDKRYMLCIPVEWLDDLGYSETDLKDWLLISRFKGVWDFSYRYYGKRTISFLKNYTGTNSVTEYSNHLFHYKPTVSGHKKNEYYVVGYLAKSTKLEAYLQLIALRYIYNVYYSDIPRTVFEIIEATGASPWEAFIIAHMKRMYYYYYSIVTQWNKDKVDGGEDFENNVLNPFKEITAAIKSDMSHDMNTSYMTTAFYNSLAIPNGKEELSAIRKLFKEKKYKEIYEHVKKISK